MQPALNARVNTPYLYLVSGLVLIVFGALHVLPVRVLVTRIFD